MDNIKKFEDFLDRMQGLLDSAKKQGHILVRVEDLENTFPELRESEDERIKKWLISQLKIKSDGTNSELDIMIDKAISWLEKQGKPTDINPSEFDLRLNKLLKQFETLPKEELASSLSFYLNVVQNDGTYKDEEKQGEQKVPVIDFKAKDWYVSKVDGKIRNIYHSVDKVEPKFKVGNLVVDNCGYVWKIEGILNQFYLLEGVEGGESRPTIEWVDKTFHLWTIQDAKDGDVLANSNIMCMFQKLNKEGEVVTPFIYTVQDGFEVLDKDTNTIGVFNLKPATKEQRDLLFAKMKEAGYKWGTESKELKEIKQKSAEWSEEDEDIRDTIIRDLKRLGGDIVNVKPAYKEEVDWLKSLKRRIGWKPSEEQMKALHDLNLTGNISYAGQGQVLIELYNDLYKISNVKDK